MQTKKHVSLEFHISFRENMNYVNHIFPQQHPYTMAITPLNNWCLTMLTNNKMPTSILTEINAMMYVYFIAVWYKWTISLRFVMSYLHLLIITIDSLAEHRWP